MSTETVTAGSVSSPIAFGYDADQLVVCASPSTCNPAGSDALRITLDSSIARISSSTLGGVRDAMAYNAYGEPASYTASVTATSATLFSEVTDTTSNRRDALGRIAHKTETIGGVPTTFDYFYDLRNRLHDVRRNGASHAIYDYDPHGNRIALTTSSGTTTATYDDQDRLLTYGTTTYTYTANGELRTKTTAGGQTTTYWYDVRSNLVRADLPNGDRIDYLIDGQDRRVGKKKNGLLVKQWLYRDQLRIAAELDGAGNLVSRFVYGSKANAPDLVIRGSLTYRVFSDHLGSPRVVVNVANVSEVIVQVEYDAFGAPSGTGADVLPMGFAAGLYDAETGLVRFGARDYDPQTGRWTSKDPILFEGDGPNVYLYTQHDPINQTDLSGLRSRECTECQHACVRMHSACGEEHCPKSWPRARRLNCFKKGPGKVCIEGARDCMRSRCPNCTPVSDLERDECPVPVHSGSDLDEED